MGVFDFLHNKTPRVDEHAENPGADAQASVPNVGPVATHQIATAREDALRLSSEATTRRKPGRPRRDSASSGPNQSALQNSINAEIASQLEAVHDPKAWGALLSAPADVALTLTGRDYWETKDRERDTLGSCGATAARVMMITNPKSLALLMLASGMFAVYMPRLIKEMKFQREEMERAKALAKQKAGDGPKP